MWWRVLVVSNIALQVSFGTEDFEGWNYVNLHCRDDHSAPVDWWYIYKPPSNVVPDLTFGHNFSYIVSNEPTRWQASDKHITANSMLQNTLMPMYRKTYSKRLAHIVYERHEGSATNSSTAYGLLMADENGGFWIGHTMPGFPDLNSRYPSIPGSEAANGHLFFCMSLDLITINQIAISIKNAGPHIVALRIPVAMKQYVKAWTYLTQGLEFFKRSNNEWLKRDNFDFLSRQKTVRAAIQIRRPGKTNCMYRDFARQRNIVLDVYGHGTNGAHRDTLCTEKYSLRSISRISLKLPDTTVLYIPQQRDRARFAVSTAAHWQRRGGKEAQYWTCISSLQNEDVAGVGGILFCVESYHVWVSFDNLKVAEPQC